MCTQNPVPRIYVHSRHPFLLQMIRKILSSDRTLDYAGLILTVAGRNDPAPCRVLLLDACSAQEWRDFARRWHATGGRTVLLVNPQAEGYCSELEVLYMGVHGILPLSEDLDSKIFPAIHSVARGRLWMSDRTVDEFVQRTLSLSNRFTPQQLTIREHEVLNLVGKGLSNKEIAQILAISERTVKFHVSNVLQKSQVATRRDLIVRLNTQGGDHSMPKPAAQAEA